VCAKGAMILYFEDVFDNETTSITSDYLYIVEPEYDAYEGIISFLTR